MDDIFISYASEDRERARLFAEAFAARGWSVWWDRHIVPGEAFDTRIEQALDAAEHGGFVSLCAGVSRVLGEAGQRVDAAASRGAALTVKRMAGAALLLFSVTAVAALPVAIDVGHYLARPGAISAHGVTEFEYNHALAAVVAARLAGDGVPVRLIGHRGEMADLWARPREAEAAGAGFFLSIHHDSVKEEHLQPWTWNGRALRYADGFAGFSLFVSRLNPRLDESLACASAIGAALRGAGLPVATHHGVSSAGVERPWADEANGVYYYDNLVVLKGATIPAVLLEAGVIVNRDEERALAGAERRALTAAAVAQGLARCGVVTRTP